MKLWIFVIVAWLIIATMFAFIVGPVLRRREGEDVEDLPAHRGGVRQHRRLDP